MKYTPQDDHVAASLHWLQLATVATPRDPNAKYRRRVLECIHTSNTHDAQAADGFRLHRWHGVNGLPFTLTRFACKIRKTARLQTYDVEEEEGGFPQINAIYPTDTPTAMFYVDRAVLKHALAMPSKQDKVGIKVHGQFAYKITVFDEDLKYSVMIKTEHGFGGPTMDDRYTHEYDDTTFYVNRRYLADMLDMPGNNIVQINVHRRTSYSILTFLDDSQEYSGVLMTMKPPSQIQEEVYNDFVG